MYMTPSPPRRMDPSIRCRSISIHFDTCLLGVYTYSNLQVLWQGGGASTQYIVGSVKGVKVVESCHCRLGCRWPFVCFMYDDHVIVMEIGYNKPHSCVRYVGFYLSDILIHWYWYQNHLFCFKHIIWAFLKHINS